MRRAVVLSALMAISLSAQSDWPKVKELESGTEVRIQKKGEKKPITAKVDEVRDDKILLVLRNEQTAVLRDDIDQLDARPFNGPPRLTTETKSTTGSQENLRPVGPLLQRPRTASTSSGIVINSKSDFKVIYKRPAK